MIYFFLRTLTKRLHSIVIDLVYLISLATLNHDCVTDSITANLLFAHEQIVYRFYVEFIPFIV